MQQTALKTDSQGKLIIPPAWEEYMAHVMADLLERQHNRSVKVVKTAKPVTAQNAERPGA
jgi:hypothetical protein